MEVSVVSDWIGLDLNSGRAEDIFEKFLEVFWRNLERTSEEMPGGSTEVVSGSILDIILVVFLFFF